MYACSCESGEYGGGGNGEGRRGGCGGEYGGGYDGGRAVGEGGSVLFEPKSIWASISPVLLQELARPQYAVAGKKTQRITVNIRSRHHRAPVPLRGDAAGASWAAARVAAKEALSPSSGSWPSSLGVWC